MGLDAAMSGWDDAHAFGTIDYMHHIAATPIGEVSAFAHGFGGMSKVGGGAWEPELGVTAGFALEW